ncbi:MAG: terminase small subunit [Chloroflexi bacterium]|nr:terminase small subunit [Chloroflexota bacterium]
MELLTRRELQERMKVAQGTTYAMQREGMPTVRTPGTRNVRFDWDAVAKWLEERNKE